MSAEASPDALMRCPGASIRITREDMREMQRQGERFTTDTRIPGSGYGSARVHCTNLVEPIRPEPPQPGRPQQPHMVGHYGLCSSCHGLEESNRGTLRARNLPEPTRSYR